MSVGGSSINFPSLQVCKCRRLRSRFICIQKSHPADSNMGNRIYWSQIYWDAKKERNGIPYFLFSAPIVKFDASQ